MIWYSPIKACSEAIFRLIAKWCTDLTWLELQTILITYSFKYGSLQRHVRFIWIPYHLHFTLMTSWLNDISLHHTSTISYYFSEGALQLQVTSKFVLLVLYLSLNTSQSQVRFTSITCHFNAVVTCDFGTKSPTKGLYSTYHKLLIKCCTFVEVSQECWTVQTDTSWDSRNVTCVLSGRSSKSYILQWNSKRKKDKNIEKMVPVYTVDNKFWCLF